MQEFGVIEFTQSFFTINGLISYFCSWQESVSAVNLPSGVILRNCVLPVGTGLNLQGSHC